MADTEYKLIIFVGMESKMKVVKGISLSVIALGLFTIGCFFGFAGHDFFYPGTGYEEN